MKVISETVRKTATNCRLDEISAISRKNSKYYDV